MTNLPILEIRSLSFTYREEPVINRLSFKISEGDFVGIIGPNGAGKTTLLRLITGFLKPGAGTVLFRGEDAASISKKSLARAVALMPQFFDILRS